jgi:hypothetical protein
MNATLSFPNTSNVRGSSASNPSASSSAATPVANTPTSSTTVLPSRLPGSSIVVNHVQDEGQYHSHNSQQQQVTAGGGTLTANTSSMRGEFHSIASNTTGNTAGTNDNESVLTAPPIAGVFAMPSKSHHNNSGSNVRQQATPSPTAAAMTNGRVSSANSTHSALASMQPEDFEE